MLIAMIAIAISYRKAKVHKTLNYIAISVFPLVPLLYAFKREVSNIYHAIAVVEDYAVNSGTIIRSDTTSILKDLGYSAEYLGGKLFVCFLFFIIAAWAKSKHIGSPKPHVPDTN